MNKVFTVLIPHYNRPERLNMLLWRITNGNYPLEKIEVIIVDGGSTKPEVEEVIMKYAELMDVIYINTKVGKWENPSRARNIAYKMAVGTYSVMLDADYIPSEDILVEFEKGMTKTNYAKGYVKDSHFGMGKTPEAEDPQTWVTPNEFSNGLPPYQLPINKIFSGFKIPRDAWHGMVWLYCIRTDIMQKVRGYDEDFIGYGVEDKDMFERLTTGMGQRPMEIPNASCIHIYHSDGTADGRNSEYNLNMYHSKIGQVKNNYIRNPEAWGELNGGEIVHTYKNK